MNGRKMDNRRVSVRIGDLPMNGRKIEKGKVSVRIRISTNEW
jgi:hypothetical protein